MRALRAPADGEDDSDDDDTVSEATEATTDREDDVTAWRAGASDDGEEGSALDDRVAGAFDALNSAIAQNNEVERALAEANRALDEQRAGCLLLAARCCLAQQQQQQQQATAAGVAAADGALSALPPSTRTTTSHMGTAPAAAGVGAPAAWLVSALAVALTARTGGEASGVTDVERSLELISCGLPPLDAPLPPFCGLLPRESRGSVTSEPIMRNLLLTAEPLESVTRVSGKRL